MIRAKRLPAKQLGRDYFIEEADLALVKDRKPGRPISPQKYILRVIEEQGLSHVKISDRARRAGYSLSAGYINSLAQGHIDSPSVRMVQALAVGLGRPEDEVFEVFRGKMTEPKKPAPKK